MDDYPDYQEILLRLIDKVHRTGKYYRGMSRAMSAKAHRLTAEGRMDDALEAATRAESLNRCACDMEYINDRATERLTVEDLAELSRLAFEHVDKKRAA